MSTKDSVDEFLEGATIGKNANSSVKGATKKSENSKNKITITKKEKTKQEKVPPSQKSANTPDIKLRPNGKPFTKFTFLGVLSDLLFTFAYLLALYIIYMLWYTAVPAYYEQKALQETIPWEKPVSQNVPAVPLDYLPCDLSNTTQWQTNWGEDWRNEYNKLWKTGAHADGDMLARVYIPKFGADYSRNMAEGTDKLQILDKQGFGHYDTTDMQGCVGNFSAAAHRDGYGEPLGPVEDLQVGDAIVIRTQKYWFVYKMISHQVVEPTQNDVIAKVPGDRNAKPTERLLTFTTCHPRWTMAQRYVVHAKFAYWAEVSSGVPQEMLDVGTHIDS